MDALYPQAHRMARFYALLSPSIVQEELGVDRGRAEALLAELERRGAVGPVFIELSRARESRISMVNDPSSGGLPPALRLRSPEAGRMAAVSAALGLVVGLAAVVGVVVWLSPIVAALPGLVAFSADAARFVAFIVLPPVAGFGAGKLVEFLFAPEEGVVPYRVQQARRVAWTLFGMAAFAFGLAVLVRS